MSWWIWFRNSVGQGELWVLLLLAALAGFGFGVLVGRGIGIDDPRDPWMVRVPWYIFISSTAALTLLLVMRGTAHP